MLFTGVTSHTLFQYLPLSHLRPSLGPSMIGGIRFVPRVS